MGKVSSCFVLRYVLKKSPDPCHVLEDFLKNFIYCIYLLLVLLGLPCCSGFPLVAASRGCSQVAVHKFLPVVSEFFPAVRGLLIAVREFLPAVPGHLTALRGLSVPGASFSQQRAGFSLQCAECTGFSLPSTSFSLQCAGFSFSCAGFLLPSTSFSLQCTGFSLQCRSFSLQCASFSPQCVGFPLQWLLLSQTMVSRARGLSSHGPGLQSTGSVAVVHRLTCSVAWGIFQEQG